jgi:nucleotide-binding universal stress UspA family protein
MTPVLALLPDAVSADQVLDAAARAAQCLQAPIEALHVRIDPASTIMPTEEALPPHRIAAMKEIEDSLAAAVQNRLATWAASHTGIAVALHQPAGAEAKLVAERGHAASLIITPMLREALRNPSPAREALDAALFDTGRPVLVLPPGYQPPPLADTPHFGTVVIGWKDIPHARAATDAATPFLRAADRIVVLGFGTDEHLHMHNARAALGRFAARTEFQIRPRDERKVGEQLIAAATELGADLLVIGAYRHGRVLEWLLGGVTGTVLDRLTLPVLMKH